MPPIIATKKRNDHHISAASILIWILENMYSGWKPINILHYRHYRGNQHLNGWPRRPAFWAVNSTPKLWGHVSLRDPVYRNFESPTFRGKYFFVCGCLNSTKKTKRWRICLFVGSNMFSSLWMFLNLGFKKQKIWRIQLLHIKAFFLGAPLTPTNLSMWPLDSTNLGWWPR